MRLTWYGHSTFLLAGRDRVCIDPFLGDNPHATIAPADVRCEIVALTHAHHDHVGDAEAIARANDAIIVGTFEVANWFDARGLCTEAMNVGGTIHVGDTALTQLPASHSSSFADGAPGGVATGFIIESGATVYHMGDTGLLRDFRTVGEQWEIDCLLVPIGDRFTMGPRAAAIAVEWVRPKLAIPMHYDTWPPVEADAAAFARDVEARCGVPVRVLKVGESVEL